MDKTRDDRYATGLTALTSIEHPLPFQPDKPSQSHNPQLNQEGPVAHLHLSKMLAALQATTSTTSLVSTSSTSTSKTAQKPYVCAQQRPHTHAAKYKARLQCLALKHLKPFRACSPSKPSSSSQVSRVDHNFTTTITAISPPTPLTPHALQIREKSCRKRETLLEVRERMLVEREKGFRERVMGEARIRAGEACGAAAAAAIEKDGRSKEKLWEGGERGVGRRGWMGWKGRFGKRGGGGTGWVKWDEGRFVG